ncbi:MAG: aminotransferase class I/II-fold pyridoxal phosphate-dependent enzyme [Acidobacteriota bacterium]|nr:aminotransferase class I/II-fold pyridoxal phosphate-dependent enzyme [Acidobacteriota bacterium]
MIDLRSDTVTKPSDAMRRAMAAAPVGDDVFEEDPTVRRLEESVASLLDFPAALFTPSGTMANQIAMRILAPPGTEVLLEEMSHPFHFEMGGMAALSGLLPRPIPSRDGILDAEAVLAAVQPDVSYKPRTSLLVVENTHNLRGGRVYRRAAIEPLLAATRRARLAAHLDGARIWNAAVASGESEAELARGFDSVTVTFSKGLGAPVGSAVLGSAAFATEARRVRKLFGGGMRQVGVLAAAAILSIENRSRLAQDHARASRLAAAVASLPGIRFDPASVETNIVIFDVPDAPSFIARLKERGVLAAGVSKTAVRLVTHLDVTDADIDRAIDALSRAAGS